MDAQRKSATTIGSDFFESAHVRAFAESPFAAFLACLCFIGVLRLAALNLNGTDLYMDEAQYWVWSRDIALGYFSKPPLIAWLIHGTTAICGDSEFCIRLPSVLLHLATSCLVYGLAARLYSHRVGIWSGLAFALLPGVSLSSGIITTDVPLLTAWALALFATAGLVEKPTARDAILLSLALGAGLNAKYAMAYFFVCAAVFFVLAPDVRRRLLPHPFLWLAVGGGLLLIAPNLVWNLSNGFATLNHTVDNANWHGAAFHPLKMLEFLVAQFGVFGPILFGALLVITLRTVRARKPLRTQDAFLIAFSLPILLIVAGQALMSRAHANWAAPAYVGAVVLVTATMVRDGAWGWMRASFGVNAAAALLLGVAVWQAGNFAIPGVGDPFLRTLGNRSLGEAVLGEIARAAGDGKPVAAILTDERETAAALAYYARRARLPILQWQTGKTPRNAFQMMFPFSPDGPYPVLFASQRPSSPVPQHFAISHNAVRTVAAGRHGSRVFQVSIFERMKKR